LRHGISVESDDLKLVPRQSELDVFGRAGVQEMEEDSLALLYSYRLAVSKVLAVNREPLIADLPAISLALVR